MIWKFKKKKKPIDEIEKYLTSFEQEILEKWLKYHKNRKQDH